MRTRRRTGWASYQPGLVKRQRPLLMLFAVGSSASPATSQHDDLDAALMVYDEALDYRQGVNAAAASSLRSLGRELLDESGFLRTASSAAGAVHMQSSCKGDPKDNMRIIGQSLGKVFNVSESDCCRLCESISLCRNWFWGKKGEFRNICWLQSSTDQYVSNPYTTSSEAVKSQGIPDKGIGTTEGLILSFALLSVAPAFLVYATKLVNAPGFTPAGLERPEWRLDGGMMGRLLSETGQSWQFDPMSLRFKDSAQEERYVWEQTAMVCKCVVPLAVVLTFATLILTIFNISSAGRVILNKNFMTWGSAAHAVHNSSFLAVFGLGVIMWWLVGVSGRGQDCKDIERIVLIWCMMVLGIYLFFNNSFSIRAMFGDNGEHLMSGGALETDADLVLYVLASNLYLNIFTPVRFCRLQVFAVCSLVLYLLKCILLGSPDSITYFLVHGIADKRYLGLLGLSEFKLVTMLGALLFMVLTGKRHLEMQHRKNFISLIKSLDLIANKDEEAAHIQSHGGNEIFVARKALAHFEKRLKKLKEHPAFETVGLCEEIHQLLLLARVTRRNLADADRLFEVNAKVLLSHDAFAAYRNHAELERYVAGAFNASLLSQNVAVNGNATELELADMTKIRSAARSRPDATGDKPHDRDRIVVVGAADYGRWLEGIGGIWNFNTLELARMSGGRTLIFVGEAVLVQSSWRNALHGATEGSLRHFIREVQRRYIHNPYHNEEHASTVTHMALWVARRCGFMAGRVSSDVERMALMIAAMAHDVGHFGRTNNFLMSSRHRIAIVWNDHSVLESMHASTCTHLAESCGIVQGMAVHERQVLRTNITTIILSTDLKFHQEQLHRFSHRREADDFLQPALPPLDGAEPDRSALDRWNSDKMLFAKLLIMAADIGHACAPWDQHFHWSLRVNLEFFEQGDEESRLGLPISPLCDRAKADIVKGQCFFIDFMAKPVFQELLKVVPDAEAKLGMHEALEQAESNKDCWAKRYGDNEFDARNHSLEACEKLAPHKLNMAKKMPYPFEEEARFTGTIGTEHLMQDLFMPGWRVSHGDATGMYPSSTPIRSSAPSPMAATTDSSPMNGGLVDRVYFRR